MGSAVTNPNISSDVSDTSRSSCKMKFICFMMCSRYVYLPMAGDRNYSFGSLSDVGTIQRLGFVAAENAHKQWGTNL